MRHENQRRARRSVQIEEQVDHSLTGHGVQISRWLIREEHGGSGNKSSCYGDALLLAAGKLVRVVALASAEADFFQNLQSSTAGIFAPGELEGEHYVFDCCQRWYEMKGLKYEADMLRAKRRAPVFIEAGELSAVQPDPATARFIESGQQCQQR